MAKYKLNGYGVHDTETGASIPHDKNNRHWREYQDWLAAGGIPDPEDVPQPPTPEDLLRGSDSGMIQGIDFLFDFLISKNILKKDDLPLELDVIYESRKPLRGV